jgi:hypothetical protein
MDPAVLPSLKSLALTDPSSSRRVDRSTRIPFVHLLPQLQAIEVDSYGYRSLGLGNSPDLSSRTLVVVDCEGLPEHKVKLDNMLTYEMVRLSGFEGTRWNKPSTILTLFKIIQSIPLLPPRHRLRTIYVSSHALLPSEDPVYPPRVRQMLGEQCKLAGIELVTEVVRKTDPYEPAKGRHLYPSKEFQDRQREKLEI